MAKTNLKGYGLREQREKEKKREEMGAIFNWRKTLVIKGQWFPDL